MANQEPVGPNEYGWDSGNERYFRLTPQQTEMLGDRAYGPLGDHLQENGEDYLSRIFSHAANHPETVHEYNHERPLNSQDPKVAGGRVETMGGGSNLVTHYVHAYHPGEKRSTIIQIHHFKDENPLQLAAMKSPAGGAVINNQYFPGGRFLPRVLGRIRRVRSAGKVRLSRTSERINRILYLNDEQAALLANRAYGPLGDHLQENGEDLAGKLLSHAAHHPNIVQEFRFGNYTGLEPKAHGLLESYDSLRGNSRIHRLHLVHPGEHQATIISLVHKKDENPFQMARRITLARKDLPLSAYSYLPRNTLNQESLTHDQIRRIEDAHGLKDNERLTESPSYKNHTTHVSAKTQDVAEFHDAIAKKRLTDHNLSEILNDPDGDPELKAVHLFHHAHDEADKFHRRQNNGSNWYEGSIEKLDTYLHHMLSREEPFNPNSKHIPDHPLWGSYDHNTGKTKPGPGLKLAKSVLAFTSANTNPNNNLHNAMKAIGAGMKVNRDDPFRNIPNADHEGLQDWLSRATAAFKNTDLFDPDPDIGKVTSHIPNTPAHLKDRIAWGEKYGHFDSDNQGWSSVPMVINRKTHTPIAKMGIDGDYIPFGGLTREDVISLKKQGLAKNLEVPNVDSQGRLIPRGWGTYGTNIGKALKRLSTLIDHRGMEGAGKFLDSSMDIKGVREYNKYAQKGNLLPEEPVPGSWIFGPKFGPFYKNISGDPYHVTMDVWFTRTMQRLLGSLINAKTGKPHANPPDEKSRRIYKKATFLAAKKLKVSPASLQAILWYHEKHLYKLFGVPTTSEDFAQVARKEMVRHGFDPKFDPATGTKGESVG